MKNIFPYRDGDKFQRQNENKEVINPYDFDSRLFQDLAQRGYNPAFVQRIDLSVAGEMSIQRPGFHFVIYGYEAGDNKPVNTSALVNVWINQKYKTTDEPFPAKHARGFSGPFHALYLEWPAQTSGGSAPVYCDLIIFSNPDRPWIDGESAT